MEITTVACIARQGEELLRDIERLNISRVRKRIYQRSDLKLIVTCKLIKEFGEGVVGEWTVNKLSHTFIIPDKF